jgi:hypothetical protein
MKRRAGLFLSVMVLGLAAAPAAQAAFQMDTQVDFATDPIAVGSSGTGTLAFSNISSIEVANSIERIVLEPSCRQPGVTPPCMNPEPGIFSIGTGTGVSGTVCAGTTFAVGPGQPPYDGTGTLQFNAQTPVPDMNPGDTCAINFAYTALAVPTFDTQGEDGIQTDQLSLVRAEHNGEGALAFGPGTGDTTVTPAPPVTTPPPAPVKKKCKKAKKRSASAAKKCRKKK